MYRYAYSDYSGIGVSKKAILHNSDQYIQENRGKNEWKVKIENFNRELESILQKLNGQSKNTKTSEIKNSLDVFNSRQDIAKIKINWLMDRLTGNIQNEAQEKEKKNSEKWIHGTCGIQ